MDCRLSVPSGLWVGLLTESMKHLVGLTVKKLVASFWWIPSPSCCVSIAPNPSAVLFASVFWIALKRGGPLGQHLCMLSTYSHIVTFIQGINVGQGVVSWNWAVLHWGRGDVVFFLPSSINSISDFFFSPVMCWNFSNRLLHFHKCTFIYGWFQNQCSV